MHALYQQYVNSKFGEPIEYSAYLDIFSETDKIPRKMKTTRWVAFSIYLICWSFVGILVLYGICTLFFLILVQFYRQYRVYLNSLLEYLISFFHRTEPLQDLDRIFSKVIDFTLFWTCIFFSIILSLNFLLEWDVLKISLLALNFLVQKLHESLF
jgi:splicing factor 3A subunit 3